MKRYTMVAYSGLNKGKADKAIYTLIGDDYSIVKTGATEIINKVAAKTVEVTNLEVMGKELKSSNGAIENYTELDDSGAPIDKIRPVVLERIEKDEKLVGYVIFDEKGLLRTVDIAAALGIHSRSKFSNGKIRHTDDGDIVQSINGLYPRKEVIKREVVKGSGLVVEIVFVEDLIGKDSKKRYAGLVLRYDNIETMTKDVDKIKANNEETKKIITSITGGENNAEALAIHRVGISYIYGVFSWEFCEAILLECKKYTTGEGGTMVSCRNFKGAQSTDSWLAVDRGCKIEDRQIDDAEASQYLTATYKTLVATLGKCKEVKNTDGTV